MCRYFCTGFFDFIQFLLDYYSLFSFNEYKKNDDKIILKIFSVTRTDWVTSMGILTILTGKTSSSAKVC